MERFLPPGGKARSGAVRLRVPPSKSVTHRALVAAALARGRSDVVGPLVAEDTEATRGGLAALGVQVRAGAGAWTVEGVAGEVRGGGRIDAAASGTTLRLLTAVAAIGAAPSRLGGTPRLAERPIEPLLAAIREAGGHAIRLDPPVNGAFVEAGGRGARGGAVTVDGSRSSQFASALLGVGACLPAGLDLSLRGPAVSLPYVGLTVEVLTDFGARIAEVGPRRWTVAPGGLGARSVEVDGDWSSASYPLTAAAILGVPLRLEGLRPDSRQADTALVPLLRALGVEVRLAGGAIEVAASGRLPGFSADLADAPDLAPAVAVLALFASGPCRLGGLAHLRHKESDRLQALEANLRALGRPAWVEDGALHVGAPDRPLRGSAVRTLGDHRIAMAFAVAGLRLAGVEPDDRACVAKSYPSFWSDLRAFGALRP